MSSKFNEDSRVKLPALMHLCSLGYEYVSEKGLTSASAYDTDTNIIKDIFKAKVSEFNPTISETEIEQLFDKIKIVLDNDDLGREFYSLLTSTSGIKLIDFERPERNSFVCVTEFTCKNGKEEFRPDITLLINGLPLGFIEVKKPNNKEGILNERNRINERFRRRKFRRFLNLSQVLVFSNNMEYDTDSIFVI